MATKPTKPEIGGRCALYKAAQARVVRWLASTTSSVSSLETVDSVELLRLGRQAAASTVDIPHNIMELLREVIAGRRYCADWYATSEVSLTQDVAKSNEGHREFIGVLEELYDVLRAGREQRRAARLAAANASSPAPKEAVTNEDPLANIFAQLNIEEPSTNPLGSDESAAGPTAKPRRARNVKVDPEQEKQFEFCCYVQDLEEIRKYCLSTWQQYHDGGISFLVASMVTSTAFSVMRQKEADVYKVIPELEDYDMITENLRGTFSCSYPGAPAPSWITDKVPGLANKSLLWLYANSNANPGAGVLENLEKCYEEMADPPGSLEELKQLMRDTNDLPPVDGSVHDLAIGLLDPARELRAFMSGGMANVKREDFPSSHDPYFRELFVFLNTGRAPVWFLFATQTYMDVYDLLGTSGGIGAQELKTFRETTTSSIKSARAMCQTMKDVPLSARQCLDQFEERSLNQCACIVKAFRRLSGGDGSKKKRRGLLAYVAPMYGHLFICVGHLQHEMLLRRSWLSMAMVNAGFYCLVTAHLYKTIRHYGLMSEWRDMDWFIKRHSRDKPLIPELPSHADGMATVRRYLMAMGATVTTARDMTTAPSSKAMKRVMRRDWNPVRLIETGSEYEAQYTARLASDQALGFGRGHVHDVVLNTMHEKAVAKQKKKQKSMKRQAAAEEIAQLSSTGIQIIDFYKEHLLADEKELQFNYLAFWKGCAEILKSVREETLPKLSKDRRKTADNIWHAVGMVLMDGADFTTSSKPVAESALGKAASMLQQYVDSYGDTCSIVAEKQCSGGIAEERRPCDWMPGSEKQKERGPSLMETGDYDGEIPKISGTMRALRLSTVDEAAVSNALSLGSAEHAAAMTRAANPTPDNSALLIGTPTRHTAANESAVDDPPVDSAPADGVAEAAASPLASAREAFEAQRKGKGGKKGKKLFRKR